jgi:hypothetical protein
MKLKIFKNYLNKNHLIKYNNNIIKMTTNSNGSKVPPNLYLMI